MSKFGSDDGSNSNGPKNNPASVDGFRLDSSQSSWLMDRLGALDEEDKISMSSAAAPQVQMSDNSDDEQVPQQDQRSEREQYEHDSGVVVQPEHFRNQQQVFQHQDGAAQVVEHSAGHEPQHAQGQMDDESESALLLRQKIENLEHQLAEISDLTGEQRAKYVDELSQPMGQHLAPGQGANPVYNPDGTVEEGSYYIEESEGVVAVHPDAFNQLTPEQVAQERLALQQQYQQTPEGYGQPAGHHGQHPNEQGAYGGQHGGHRDEASNDQLSMVPDYGYHQQEDVRVPVHHDASGRPVEQGGQHGYHEQGQHQHEVYTQGHHPQAMVPSRQVQTTHNPQDFGELPQFLAPLPQEQKRRPAYLSLLGSFSALLIVGGVAYTYLNSSVSDVIKSNVADVRFKEGLKLSDVSGQSADRVVPKPKETEVAAVTPTVNLAEKFSVKPMIGTAGQNIPLKIVLPNSSTLSSAFLVIRNLPDWAKLNFGRQMNGLWMVSVSQVASLEIKVPEDQPGKFLFEVDLVVSAGEAPLTKKVSADIAPYKVESKVVEVPEAKVKEKEVAAIAPKEEESELIKQPSTQVQKGPLIIDQALEEKWLERGTRLLRAGDVSAARLAFSHLAEQGSGRAALAMGMTFDPNQPSARLVSGIKSDVNRAKFWYQRALSLGNESARDPLRQLGRK